MNIFATLPSGDSATWVDDPVKLPDGRQADASAWTLKYSLRGASVLDLVAVASGKGWSTSITTAQSAALVAGTYVWSAAISKAAERLTIGNGSAVITPDLSAVSAAYDGRSLAQKALEACEAAMATFNATGGKVKKYEIAGRTMEFQTIGDLMTLHSFWKLKVTGEQSASSIANGLGNPRNLLVRFVKAGR